MPNIGDIHYAIDLISRIYEIFFEHILHYIRTEVAYMGKMIHGGAAGVHCYPSLLVCVKFILASCQ